MKLDGGASLTLITSSIYSSRRSKKNQGNINELACVQITETTREKLRATRAIYRLKLPLFRDFGPRLFSRPLENIEMAKIGLSRSRTPSTNVVLSVCLKHFFFSDMTLRFLKGPLANLTKEPNIMK